MPGHAISDEEIENCFSVMKQLRPHLVRELFLAQVREMEKDGFRIAYIEEDGEVVTVSGYRIYTTLFMGKNLYVDDLVTSEQHRSKGYGEEMINWLRGIGRENGCNYLHLDSGTQRHAAHKFYLCQGLSITSFHFAEQLKNS